MMSALIITTKAHNAESGKEINNFVFQVPESVYPEETILLQILSNPEGHRDIIGQLNLVNVVNSLRIFHQSATEFTLLSAKFYSNKNTKFIEYQQTK